MTLNKKVESILINPSACAFFAGAGISIPSPSLLPSANAFIDNIIGYITTENNYKKIITDNLFNNKKSSEIVGNFLRFETLMAKIAMCVDPQLEILKVYTNCSKPNFYHYFLAKQLDNGAIIVTTNFDNLIEIACHELSIDYNIIVDESEIINFCKDSNKFKNPILKLHGGYNVIGNNKKIRSGPINLKATLMQVGRNFNNFTDNTLSELLSIIFQKRHVCIIGYSGCDDFDIMPIMKKINIRNGMTWIQHDQNINKFVQYGKKFRQKKENLDKSSYIEFFLYELSKKIDSNDIVFIRGETESILKIDPIATNSSIYDWKSYFLKWKKHFLKKKAYRDLLLSIILFELEQYTESINILSKIKKYHLKGFQYNALNFILACSYYFSKDYDKAIIYFTKNVITKKNVNPFLKGLAYYSLARINTDRRNFDISYVYLSKAFEIFKSKIDIIRLSDCFHELGRIKIGNRNLYEGIRDLEKSAKISEKAGDLNGLGMSYKEIAGAYRTLHKLNNAQKYLNKAYTLFSLTGYKYGLAQVMHEKGLIESLQKQYEQAERLYKKAIKLEREIGSNLDLAHSLHNIGELFFLKHKFADAKKCFKESISLKKIANDKQGIENSRLYLALLETMENFSKNQQQD